MRQLRGGVGQYTLALLPCASSLPRLKPKPAAEKRQLTASALAIIIDKAGIEETLSTYD